MTCRALFALALAVLVVPIWAAATPASAAGTADPVVARINGTELHRSDVLEALRSLPPQARQQQPDKLYQRVLEQLVANVLVAQAGRKDKLAEDPEVKRRMALIRDQVIGDVYIEHLLRKDITEAKLKARYEKYLKDAPPEEEVKARHILLPTEAAAKAVIAELNKGADFAKLAAEKTTDPAGKTSGGDLGWFTKDQMVPQFADAAFKLKKGQITETPVHTQFGWHVIKVEDRRKAKPPTFEEIKPQLANEMSREIVAARIKELRKEAKIEVYNLDGSKPGAHPAAPPPAPVGAAPNLGVVPGVPTLAPGTAPPQLAPATKPKE